MNYKNRYIIFNFLSDPYERMIISNKRKKQAKVAWLEMDMY